eukprot:CAMPEP_0117450060 /NCGR_PEP_ID=MMETSP0759-20121206/8270_1 /TAXON_ID=63605 /ORGANISM="Percolomonas cosmopolitus, Strain WS" /LENGTH=265 /DNA_ID=CAMNT_0005242563 /DNA_START=94 /DNA_END=891 /DNA_ORIENTATION=-
MCLERCDNYTPAQIEKNLDIIKTHSKQSLTSVSYEIYNIGANGTIYQNDDLTAVHETLAQYDSFYEGQKLKTFPMISSYPYPPELINWMRYTFAHPDEFVSSVLEHITKLEPKCSGVNVDFEPVSGITVQDSIDYAKFLNYFSNALAQKGYETQVDVASWNVLWNYTLLGQQENVKSIVTMSTYAGPQESWTKAFAKATTEIPIQKLNVGLMSTNPTGGKYLTNEEIVWRFENMKQKGVQSVSVWRMTNEIPDQWWKSFEDFLRN